jgi:histidinol-phosphate aminotransferase
VLRTLSKAYGLAGLRLGGLLASPVVVHALKKIKAPFSLSSAVLALSLDALSGNKPFFAWAVEEIIRARQTLKSALQQSPWIEVVYPSAANFILIKTPYAKPLFAHFERLGLAVRQFNNELSGHLRITVGTTIQNQRLLQALASFTGEQ